ncbi:MAG: rhodanese-like domain-containing protein [Gammaproteobacteria bacterium]
MTSRLFRLALLVVALSGCAGPPYNNLDNEQLKAMLEQGTPIYDIRRPEEWRQTGVIADSQLLTFVDDSGRMLPDFMRRFTSAVGKDDPVVLICRTGSRTSTLARHLVEQLGYTKVYNVRDGIIRWIRDGRPVAGKRISIDSQSVDPAARGLNHVEHATKIAVLS